MHATTGGLVLRSVNYKEADQILTVMTEEFGKITLSARGSRRANSRLSAGIQLLCWSEFVLYERGGRWYIKEVMAKRQFSSLRQDIARLSLACYCAELCDVMAVEGIAMPELLSLTLNTLHILDQQPEKSLALVKTVYELRLMALSGYEPMVDHCVVCGREQPEQPQIHLREGGLHCAACRSRLGDGVAMPLSVGALAALRHILWQQPKRIFSFAIDELSLARLSAFAESYVLVQLERGLRTLDYYKQIASME